jgi:uncharacterized membrane protein YdbT with pleckstrin-like domain
MAYIDELLGSGEQILYVARQHIFVLISHIITELVLIAILVAAGVASNMAFQGRNEPLFFGLSANSLILLICVVISLFVLLSSFFDYLRWSTEEYYVTDRRLLQIQGLLNKTVTDSSLEKINDVQLRQSVFGRMFDFGTIEVLTASGEEGVNVMDRISAPLEFKKAMLEAKHNYERGYGYLDPAQQLVPRPVSSPGEIQRTLEELASLRDRGILSTDEFEAKKRELLSRI